MRQFGDQEKTGCTAFAVMTTVTAPSQGARFGPLESVQPSAAANIMTELKSQRCDLNGLRTAQRWGMNGIPPRPGATRRAVWPLRPVVLNAATRTVPRNGMGPRTSGLRRVGSLPSVV